MQVRIEDDFDPRRIAESGQCFRWSEISQGVYRIISRDKCLRIKALDENSFDMDCSEKDYREFWFDYLDLQENYTRIRQRISREKDEFLYHAAEYERESGFCVRIPGRCLLHLSSLKTRTSLL